MCSSGAASAGIVANDARATLVAVTDGPPEARDRLKLRRISTKFVLAVLAAVIVPFCGFAVFVDQTVAKRSLEVVKQALVGLATDLAREVDREIEHRRGEIALWTADPRTHEAIVEARSDRERTTWGVAETRAVAAGRRPGGPDRNHRREQTLAFDRYVENSRVYDLLLLVDADGRLVSVNCRGPDGAPLPELQLDRLFAWDFGAEGWFDQVVRSGEALVDHHRSERLGLRIPDDPSDLPRTYHIGIARAIHDVPGGEFAGALLGLVNWKTFDDLLRAPLVKDYFRGMVPEDVVPSPYAWIWGADADTILAHQDPRLIEERVSGELVNLPQMVADARSGTPGEAGLFREYTFHGVRKNAAFKQCAAGTSGFGWFVGVGINNEDIFAVTEELTALLYKGTAGVLLACVLWVLVIARRTTKPILALQTHTRRVAEGDLSARIEIGSRDELGELADAFNAMTRDLSENREALIKAEKDAAWREMARQIAHDIKNPLTPMKLSLDLLRRARAERRGDLEEILDRTLALMDRQVDNLREIATDFYEFTGGRKPVPQRLDTRTQVDEVLELHGAWAQERGVSIHIEGESRVVWADPGKLRRVLTNLVSNALQAMDEGGRLLVRIELPDESRVRIEILDTGAGLSPEARERLFEPFFTTKGEGTGLGLAISKRVVEEMGGDIELEPRADAPGTVARLDLPTPPEVARPMP